MAIAALTLFGCSPRVIDAVVEGEQADGAGVGGAGGTTPVSDAHAGEGFDASSKTLLVHRYSFSGVPGQTVIPDSVPGGGNAIIYNAALAGDAGVSFLQLSGGGAQGSAPPAYVDLPNFLVSRLTNLTIEAWVAWDASGAPWQRIFDFGEDFSGADLDAAPRLVDASDHTRDGRGYVYLTVMDLSGVMRLAYLRPEDEVPRSPGVTARETSISYTRGLPVGARQIDVTIQGQTMSLYLDGVQIDNSVTLPGRLADIYDVNCWLGRSQFPADPMFEGRFYDFRIYGVALSPQQILANGASGYAAPAIQ
jgi:hypothetical protein